MRKIFKAGICVMTAAMLMTGCSGKDKTAASTEASTSAEAQETEAYVAEGSIKLGKYKGVELTVKKADATEEQLNSQIEQMLSANSDYVETVRAAEIGDKVNIDYKGLLDGKEFDGGSAEGYDLELGSNSFIEGFEDGLVGVKKGDKKDLNLTFPENYEKNLAGKAVVFQVTVNSVQGKVIPELNDEFVKKISPEDGDVEGFRQTVRESITNQNQQDIETQRNMDLITAIMSDSEIICATEDVDAEYEIQLANYTSQASMYGMELADYAGLFGMDEAGFKSEIRELARDITKQKMLYEEIAKQENITVADEDRLNIAKANGFDTAEELVAAYSQEEVDIAALSQKILEFLLENAVITTEDSTAETTAAVETTAAAK